MKNKTLKEKDVLKQILQYLNMNGHFVWRNNSGAFVLKDKGRSRFFRAGKVGSPDVLGVENKTGKMLAIEVKVKGNYPSEEQKIFLEDVLKRNGIAFVAYSLEDVINRGL